MSDNNNHLIPVSILNNILSSVINENITISATARKKLLNSYSIFLFYITNMFYY